MIYGIVTFLFICFVISIYNFKTIGKPYNGLFVLVSGILFVGLLIVKFENIKIETPWVKIQNQIDTISVQQQQLAEIVETTIELIEL